MRRRQPEAVLDEHFLARAIAGVHAANLRNRLVALVDDRERIGRQVVEQRRRRRPGRPPGEVPRVVLDAVAVADLLHHREIEHRPLVQALGLEQPSLALEEGAPLDQFRLDRLDGDLGAVARRHEVALRVDRHLVVAAQRAAGQRVDGRELVDLVAEQLDADRALLVGRIDLDDVAAHAERAAGEVGVVALVLDLDQLAQDRVAPDRLAALERQHQPVVRLRRTEAVDARHARDDDDVATLEEGPRGRQPHAVDLLVDDRFLLDVRVRGRHVGLGLVVVVVGDEVLDGVVREEAPELLVQLGGQGLVVDHDERRAVHPGDRLRHGEGLARPGDAEQGLERVAALESAHQFVDGPWLVAPEFEGRDQLEAIVRGWHGGEGGSNLADRTIRRPALTRPNVPMRAESAARCRARDRTQVLLTAAARRRARDASARSSPCARGSWPTSGPGDSGGHPACASARRWPGCSRRSR